MDKQKYVGLLHKIILSKKTSNSFIPTSYQVTQLKNLNCSYAQSNSPFNGSRNEWLSNLKVENNKSILTNFSPPLFFGKFHRGTKNDHEKRAQYILKQMQLYKKTSLITMDGHGRMIWSIMNQMNYAKIPSSLYGFVLADIDKDVTEWHKNFLPKGIACITYNILDMYLNNIFVSNKDYLYLNFCGTYGQRNKILMCAHKLIIQKVPFMISFSLRSKNRTHFTKDGSLTNVGLYSVLIKMGCDVLCRNGMYVTLCYDIK